SSSAGSVSWSAGALDCGDVVSAPRAPVLQAARPSLVDVRLVLRGDSPAGNSGVRIPGGANQRPKVQEPRRPPFRSVAPKLRASYAPDGAENDSGRQMSSPARSR